MAMYWRSPNKHDLGSLERVLVIKFKLQCVALSNVDSALRHRKTDAPDRYGLVYNLK